MKQKINGRPLELVVGRVPFVSFLVLVLFEKYREMGKMLDFAIIVEREGSVFEDVVRGYDKEDALHNFRLKFGFTYKYKLISIRKLGYIWDVHMYR